MFSRDLKSLGRELRCLDSINYPAADKGYTSTNTLFSNTARSGWCYGNRIIADHTMTDCTSSMLYSTYTAYSSHLARSQM